MTVEEWLGKENQLGKMCIRDRDYHGSKTDFRIY